MLLALVAASQITWRGVRYLPSAVDQPAVRWHISNRTLDLSQATLLGSRSDAQESYTGVGLLLDHCSNVTLKGISIHGYRINLVLDECRNVRIESADLDRSHSERIVDRYGQMIDRFLDLRSVDEWRSYGAGIWLRNCAYCSVKGSHMSGAMTGAIMEGCLNSKLCGCDCSYNSAWGIALWKSNQNIVDWNHADFCNRPWGGGWGGDAAGFAVVGSSRNAFVGNSFTHGGDGFFLSDLVQGGWSDADNRLHEAGTSDDNFVAENDGSWSPHNAFEGTFSSGNAYWANRADDSDYGFWLGYSARSSVLGNEIARESNDGIAIEHGRSNQISFNNVRNCKGAGIRLWSDAGPRDVAAPSTRNEVTENAVVGCGTWLMIPGSTESKVAMNRQAGNALVPVPPAQIRALRADRPDNWKFYRDEKKPLGYGWIQPGAYAPWPNETWAFSRETNSSYKIWTGLGTRGLEVPAWVHLARLGTNYWVARCDQGDPIGRDLRAKITAYSGEGKFQLLALPFRSGDWACRWFKWSGLSYLDRGAWQALFRSSPAAANRLDRLDADWSYRSPIPGVLPSDHFALVATRAFDFDGGTYHFFTSSDDGIRLFLDGREIISRWNHHGATADGADVNLSAGVHDLRVEYCQEDGAAVLKVDWVRSGT